jgi:hypothetical protein
MMLYPFHQTGPIIGLSLLLGLAACKQTPQNNKVQSSKHGHTIAVKAPQTTSDTITADDCPRGEAEPVVQKSAFPDARFSLHQNKREATETLTLNTGDQVTITHSGCEYYTLSIRFETSRFKADTANIGYWSHAALLLMRALNQGIKTPLGISRGLDSLDARIQKQKVNPSLPLALNNEIDFGGPDPREYLSIDRVTQLPNGRYALVISFSYGPI